MSGDLPSCHEDGRWWDGVRAAQKLQEENTEGHVDLLEPLRTEQRQRHGPWFSMMEEVLTSTLVSLLS